MSRFTLRHSVAALALVSVLGSGVAAVAQTATPEAPAATQPAAPTQTPALTAETLPEALRALNMSDVEIRTGQRGGSRVTGTLADGTEIQAMVANDGTLRGVRADDDAALPQSLVDAVLPAPVRGNAIIQQFALISGFGVMPDMVMVGGQDADGQKLRAGFATDGTLMRFGRGDDRGPGMHGDRDRGGKRGFDGRGHDRGKGEYRGPRGDRGERGDAPARMDQRGPQVDESALRQSLTDAGYTDLGDFARQQGRGLTVNAVNASGENVTLELNRAGDVIRETAR
ncbi:MAG: hypothetical protein Q4G22_00865 [Paracoccus sp. (in: a-proteobacteria)]|uniref:hypothetical protein n=1 Tax=Paracoccus sp. TaxID=267 RepID=UPI0026DFDD0E|nr:hypothetical protein [Paracoccus sp. (in: a-proteobacteria)]MDO5630368.1 hypothetical protein [Paracoccus sp. (in: a-proteobacteria)]